MESSTSLTVFGLNIAVVFKKVKRMTVTVYRFDNHVELTVPYGTTEGEMIRFVLQKLSWIKKTRHINEYSKTEVESFRAYIAGVEEVVRTTGSRMTLKVEPRSAMSR